jgi:predicted alpha/beta hydrolase family esterase
MEKRVILVHGWGGTQNGDWFLWLKTELEKEGVKVIAPQMPDTFVPKIDAWITHLSDNIGTPDSDTYLVGHSIGCQAIIRYLEKLKPNEIIGGALLVAAWLDLTDETWDDVYRREIAEPWIKAPINWQKVKSHASRFTVLLSDDDPYVPSNTGELFKEKLGAKIVIVHKRGHITAEDGVKGLDDIKTELNLIMENSER